MQTKQINPGVESLSPYINATKNCIEGERNCIIPIVVNFNLFAAKEKKKRGKIVSGPAIISKNAIVGLSSVNDN